MPLAQFDDKQCSIFILDSKTQFNSPETTDPEIIRWKFMGFKSHPSHHLFITDPVTLLNSGRAALNVRTLIIKGKFKTVTQVTDLLAVKSRASLLSFLELIRQYRSLNSDVVLHTSNENSEKIYLNFFKFKEVFKLSAFGFPIRPHKLISFFKTHPYLGGIISIYSFLLEYLMSFLGLFNFISLADYSFSGNEEALLKSFAERETSLLRSSDFLKWRYFKSPYEYKLYTVFSCKKPIGILAARLTQFQGAYFFLVMDYMGSSKLSYLQSIGIRLALISEAISEDADAIFGLFNKNNIDLKTFFRLPFVSIDDKMLPHRTPIFASSLSPAIKVETLEKMYFSLGDLDYF